MKVLIVLDNIHVGGISKALLNFLPYISKHNECDLLVFNYEGLDKEQIPQNINIIEPDRRLHILGMSQSEIKNYSWYQYILRAFLVMSAKLLGGNFARNLLFSFINNVSGYDLAISYSQDVGWNTLSTGCNHFVLKKVEAKYKASVIHCDYEHFGGYHEKQIDTYGKFDKVLCVSESCMKSFIRMFPALENICYVCENFTNVEEIQEKLKKNGTFKYDKAVKNILTVCRLSEEKGIYRALNAFFRLKSEGYKNFKWFLVGYGPEQEKIEKYIKDYGLETYVELLGKTDNPFYHMKDADFFLLPSIHEAAPMVFGECSAVGLPILTTNTSSAKELVEKRGLGIVCDNSEDGIYTALKDIFDEEAVFKTITQDRIKIINENAEKQLEVFLKYCVETKK